MSEARTHPGPGLPRGLFRETALRYVCLAWRALVFPGPWRARYPVRRATVLAFFVPGFGLLQALHWVAFRLDDWFFPAVRGVPVEAPVFIVGVPRSGTTFLHRVLARDTDRFTTLTLWELVLAPALVERRLIGVLATLDGHLGRPGARVLRGMAGLVTGGLRDVHRLALEEPEEDFLLLLPALACFILVAAFPDEGCINDLSRFDERLPAARRRRILAFYRAMIQRHLYARGAGRVLLSKNVSFTPMLRSLLETFPDARLVVCVRDPAKTVPSQASSMAGAWRFFGNEPAGPDYGARWVELMRHYYTHQAAALRELPRERAQLVRMDDLRQNLVQTVRRVYKAFGIEVADGFAAELEGAAAESRAYRSAHHYDHDDFGIDASRLAADFAPVYGDGQDPRDAVASRGADGGVP